MITSLGIGEALISTLDEKGRPTPLAATMLRAPMSRMDILSQGEITEIINSSKLVSKYNTNIDRESAYEILNGKISRAEKTEARDKAKKERDVVTRSSSRRNSRTPQNPVIKVLTSATFIRGVMSILNKTFK